jgi:transposase-like protein
MSQRTTARALVPEASSHDVVTDILRQGAQKMLAAAIQAEVDGYISENAGFLDAEGHRLVVRNGYLPERDLQSGVGSVTIRQPRIDDRRVDEAGEKMRFTSKILPPYLRRTRSIEDLLPWLYLKGISTGDFSEALAALLGPNAPGLSPTTIGRLKQIWEKEHEDWSRRSFEGKRFVYFWVDGVYLRIRLGEGEKQCVLVVMGATEDGRKELVAIQDGVRESEQSWRELLLDLKHRGLAIGPELAVGDGALGFWSAIAKVFPKTRAQRCWMHKTGNVLNYLPKSKQPFGKDKLHEIWMAETKADAVKAFVSFIETFESKYPKATECLEKDKDELLAFYDFPAEHWRHLRTTNPIESTFATVRLRTHKTKGAGSRLAALAMVFKLAKAAEGHWRLLNGSQLLKDLIEGKKFKDGIKVPA